jgi:hypothetical protein
MKRVPKIALEIGAIKLYPYQYHTIIKGKRKPVYSFNKHGFDILPELASLAIRVMYGILTVKGDINHHL